MKKGKKTAKVPNLRFPGFEEDWEEKRLGEIGTILTGSTPPTNDESYYNGEYLFASPADINNIRFLENTRTTLTEKGFNKGRKVRKGSSLFVCIGSTIGKVAQTNDECITNQQINAVIPNEYNDDFVFSLLEYHSPKIKTLSAEQAVPIINKTTFANVRVKVPSDPEQNKIAEFLSLIDERIQAQNKIIEELNILKTTAAKRTLSKQLRFKNINGDSYADWDMKKMGDITTLLNKRNKSNEKLPVYSINNKLGFIPQNEQFDGVDSDDRGYDITLYKIIDKNTFAYNPARINVGSIGYSGNLENIIISSLYVCFQTKDSVNDDFLFQYLKTEMFNKKVLSHVEGGVREYLFYENFARIKLDFPHVEEQIKIVSFLSSIDSKIISENEVLQKLEEQKKFLLRQLFV